MGQSLHATSGERQSNPGKHWQRSVPILSEAPSPQPVDESIISRCDSLLDAIHLCIYLSRFAHERIAGELGIDPGHWTRMMQGRAHFPPNRVQPLMELCGNLAPLQYLMACNGLRYPQARTGMRDAEAA